MYNYEHSINIIHEKGSIKKLGLLAEKYGKKALIVTGKNSTKKTGVLDRVIELLKTSGVQSVIFNEVEPNPLTSTVARGVEQLHLHKCELVIGLGGGSAMDCAKAIAFSARNPGDINAYVMGEKQGKDAFPILLVTTSAGTGSEGNSLSVLTNDETLDKKSLKHPSIYAKASIVDPELMVTMPKKGIASCGFDAFTHCFEALTAKRATPETDQLCIEGIKNIFEFLPKVYHNPMDVESWSKVAHANTLGGIAIDRAGVNIPHGLEHPVSGLLNVAHGEGLAAVFTTVLKENGSAYTDKIIVLAKAMGVEVNRQEAVMWMVEQIDNLLEQVHMKVTLRDLGVKEEHIEWLCDNAFKTMTYALTNQENNINHEKVKALYEKCLKLDQSESIIDDRNKYVARGIGNLTNIVAKEAKCATITDVNNDQYIDFAAGIGVQNVGHCHPKVIEAVTKQTNQLIHPCFHVTMYEGYINLAKKLVEKSPIGDDAKAMFANSGAEAVENAIKIARKYTKRTGIVSLETAFHGRTFMAMTLTSKVKPYKYGFGPYMPDTYKVPSAYCYRCPFGKEVKSCDAECAMRFEHLLKTEIDADNIAALILEPVQGEGGFIDLPNKFIKKLRETCTKYGILMIMDEVQTGFGRTGTLFATEQCDVVPDLMVLSKGIAAGLPISAVIGKSDIMDTPNPGEIGGTYGGSPLACEAALAVLDIIEEENLLERSHIIGQRIEARLKKLQEQVHIIGDIRGKGAMVGVEFVKDQNTKESYSEIVKPIINEALANGAIFIGAGIHSNVIRFLPPLTMTDEELEKGLSALESAILKCYRDVIEHVS